MAQGIDQPLQIALVVIARASGLGPAVIRIATDAAGLVPQWVVLDVSDAAERVDLAQHIALVVVEHAGAAADGDQHLGTAKVQGLASSRALCRLKRPDATSPYSANCRAVLAFGSNYCDP